MDSIIALLIREGIRENSPCANTALKLSSGSQVYRRRYSEKDSYLLSCRCEGTGKGTIET
jgi:hypothetical protein